jgi:hypothetical protein
MDNLFIDLTNGFMGAYLDAHEDVYREAKNSFLVALASIKPISQIAADYLDQHQKMSTEEFVKHFVLEYVPFLAKYNYPAPYSTDWGNAQSDFIKSKLN